jgi:hypothetical protein
MTRASDLEYKLQTLDVIIEGHENLLTQYKAERHQVWMNLNRARRLEREELQNGKH